MRADDWSDRERRTLAAAIDLPGWRVWLTELSDGRFRAVATYTKGWYLPCGHRSVSATGRTREIAVASLARAARFHWSEPEASDLARAATPESET